MCRSLDVRCRLLVTVIFRYSGVFIAELVVIDPDILDQEFQFDIVGFASVNSRSGVPFGFRGLQLYSTAPLDYETDPRWLLIITACDRGNLCTSRVRSTFIQNVVGMHNCL